VETLGDDLVNLNALRTLNCRHNRLIDEGIPKDIFNLEDLQVVVHSNIIFDKNHGKECKQAII
jgi:hypothetical protein